MVLRRLVFGVAVAAAVAIAAGTIHLTKPAWYERLWYPLRYQAIVQGHARNYHLDGALLAAVIYQESKLTAEGIALRTGGTRFRVADLYDPEIHVRYGAWYLRHLLDKYGDERLALAAYNAGQRNVDLWRRERRGIPFSETRAYVDHVEELKGIYRHAYGSRLDAIAASR